MAKASKPSFNVADDPWIQVTMRDGTFREVSLRFVLKNSQDVASIGGDIPQQAVAIVRAPRTCGDDPFVASANMAA